MRIGKTGPSNTPSSRQLQYRRQSSYPLGVGWTVTQEQESVCRSCGGSMADVIRFPRQNLTLTLLVS